VGFTASNCQVTSTTKDLVNMKAAVITQFGDTPRYQDFPDPVPETGDLIVDVKAVALEVFDKVTAKGTHYASKHLFPAFPAIVGHSGVGTLQDGTLVAFGGVRPPYGTMAEQAVIPQQYKAYISSVPEGVDATVAAALPASALTSYLPLKWGVKLQPGETVLVNGATGVSGKVAVQIAKLLGARRVVGTGREETVLQSLAALGADATVDLSQPDKKVTEAFRREAGKGYDVILDYVWGRPTELLLGTLVPKEVGFAQRRTRLVQIGEAAGPAIALTAETLRTSGVEISGAGNVSPVVIPESVQQIWEWIKESKLKVEIERVLLRDIGDAWERKTTGRRIVIVP
jgi:NADPH:quinone reductase-like Zn-dependent oxidoreductase